MKRKTESSFKRRFAILAFSLLTTSTWAGIRITSFNPSISDEDATKHPVLDKYGNYCALIKIKTPIEGLSADALQLSMKGKTRETEQTLYVIEPACADHPNETWLYVSSKTTRFRLSHPSYGGLTDDSDVRFGFYYAPTSINAGEVYDLSIECNEENNALSSFSSPMLPKMACVTFETEDNRAILTLDGNKVKAGRSYRVIQGEHTFIAYRPFHKTIKEKYNAKADQPLQISATPEKATTRILAGPEVARPSAYSDIAYGARASFLFKHWGGYASMVASGGKADGYDVDTDIFIHESEAIYNDARCHYLSVHAGAIYRLVAPLHVYAGMGFAKRDITWSAPDGKRHAYVPDCKSGFSWEGGLLCNVNKFYVSIGTDYLKGGFGGRLGLGVYLTNNRK